ncbi:hypothetical protein KQH65_07305 [archaeon]|nr:hypothetical protein [archaeon]
MKKDIIEDIQNEICYLLSKLEELIKSTPIHKQPPQLVKVLFYFNFLKIVKMCDMVVHGGLLDGWRIKEAHDLGVESGEGVDNIIDYYF